MTSIRSSACSLAVAAAFPAALLAAQSAQGAPLEIWFNAPQAGAAVSGTLGSTNCILKGYSVARVDFFVDSTKLNSLAGGSGPWSCQLDTSTVSNGSHALKAVAYNTSGASYTEVRSINVQNAPPPNPLEVWFNAPQPGATVSGALGTSNCILKGNGVARVDFFVDSTRLNSASGGAGPWGCQLDTRTVSNGAHALKAVAYDASGKSYTELRSINVQNSGALPTAGKAIATFESLGLYWTPPSNPGAAGCDVSYRKSGDTAFKPGLAMWYDARNNECRGSLVFLAPDTAYEVQFAMPGQSPVAQLTARTWSENFPIAKTVQVQSGSQTLNITQGGSADGYVLYTGAATIDAANAQDYNVVISAPYVIVRGLTLKNAVRNGIQMVEGAHDVVIEGNDISGWGSSRGAVSSEGWQLGTDEQSAINARCDASNTQWLERTIIQRNRIHDPRYGANSWSDGHPAGPNAIAYYQCGGNHVMRYNDIYSSWGHYFMDAIGGGENFSTIGFPNRDSDIYGNKIQQVWDDAIESEGANTNVRIWGNYMNQTNTGVATTVVSVGPVYLFRNVWNRSRNLSMKPLDSDERLYMFKAGSTTQFGDGRRYVFHNTMLQAAPPAGSTLTLGGGQGLAGPNGSQTLTNTVSRNNIFHVWKSWWAAVDDAGGGMTQNDLDYDLTNGGVSAYAGAEGHRLIGAPTYAPGNGPAAEDTGMYQLAPDSAGYDKGVRIPNFNDDFIGAAPDIGAHEAGTPAMKFGVQ